MGLGDSYAHVLAFLEFCSTHEYKGTPPFVRCEGLFLEDVVKQWFFVCFIKCQLFMSIGFTFGTAG